MYRFGSYIPVHWVRPLQTVILSIAVVLDRREDKTADTGGFELAYKDSHIPPTRVVDTKLMLEGSRIRKNYLQKYTDLDQKNTKADKERQRRELEKEVEREIKEREEQARREKEEKEGGEVLETSMVETSMDTKASAGEGKEMEKPKEMEKSKEKVNKEKDSRSRDSKQMEGRKKEEAKNGTNKANVRRKDGRVSGRTVAAYGSKPAASWTKKK